MADYLVADILPAREIHLLAGPTGAGKTRWLLETLIGWEVGKPVLGYQSFPCKWLYASADRSEDGTKRTLDSLGIALERVPILAAWDDGLTLGQIFDAAKQREAKLVVIEGFGKFSPSHNNSSAVSCFLQAVHRAIRQQDITLLGVVEQPKMRQGMRYNNPRQRVSGPSAWGHSTETIFLVEFWDERVPKDPRRRFHLLARNIQSRELAATIETGHFEFLPRVKSPT